MSVFFNLRAFFYCKPASSVLSLRYPNSLSEVTDMNYEALGLRIRQQRKLMKMTQEELARAAGVSTAFIGHIERGIKHCSLDTLIALCNALDTSPNTFLQDSLEHAPIDRDSKLSPRVRAMLDDIAHVLREHDNKDE